MANAARNEIEIELCGKTHHVRPSFEMIARIEGALGQGALALGQKVASGVVPLMELSTILWHATKPKGTHPLKLQEIGDYLMEHGITGYMGSIGMLLMRAFTGNKASDEAEAEGAGPEAEKPETQTT